VQFAVLVAQNRGSDAFRDWGDALFSAAILAPSNFLEQLLGPAMIPAFARAIVSA
jgi:hypothetical protein